MPDLTATALKLVADHKGILAADESLPTIQKRFDTIGVENTSENRQVYRELLFSTPEIEKYISGVILFDETLRAGLGQTLIQKGIIPGVKVDLGTVEINSKGEKITQGIDGLTDRLKEYVSLGAKFAKWRAVYKITSDTPSQTLIEANAHSLAQYAYLCQQAGLVPIVEPEVLMDGDHDLTKCEDITRAVLTTVFVTLQDYQINLSGILLKPNMVVVGKDKADKPTPTEIAQSTLSVLERCVSSEVPGIVFLSGGMTPEESTTNLNAINQNNKSVPWELSFSFGRALQEPVLKAWSGKEENKEVAQKIFLHRCKMNWLARQGKYSPDLEK